MLINIVGKLLHQITEIIFWRISLTSRPICNSIRIIAKIKEMPPHYSTLYHATSQWIMRSDTRFSF